MIKPSRRELTIKVVRLAKLSPGKTTSGYLNRSQLLQLIVFLEHCIESLDKKEVDNDGEERA
jgi:hypothetical protein